MTYQVRVKDIMSDRPASCLYATKPEAENKLAAVREEILKTWKTPDTSAAYISYNSVYSLVPASLYNYEELVNQVKSINPVKNKALYDGAIHELGVWFRCYSDGLYWNGEYWDCSEAGIRIRPVYVYNDETDEVGETDDYEEV